MPTCVHACVLMCLSVVVSRHLACAYAEVDLGGQSLISILLKTGTLVGHGGTHL